ncbi:MAG: carbon-nitrogen hydrolase family protein [Propionibacteriaceae bacterium]
MRIALAQIVASKDLAGNLDLVRLRAAEAATAGADLVVFPEATMRAFGYNLTEIAEPVDGPWASAVRDFAREQQIVIVVGMFTPGDAGRVRNTLLATGPGVEAAYDKIHLFDAFSFAESDTVTAGDTLVTIEVAGVRVGLATCYDVRFPGLFTALADRGAELVVLPASWGGGEGKLAQWQLLVCARALDTTCFVAACDQADPVAIGLTGSGSAPTGIGHSLLVDPLGRVLNELGSAPEMMIIDLDLNVVECTRTALPVLKNRKLG